MASRLQAVFAKLGERSGEAIGGAYALVAGSIQQRFERLEDANAERRFQQRAKSGAPSGPAAPQLTASTAGNVSPTPLGKGSV